LATAFHEIKLCAVTLVTLFDLCKEFGALLSAGEQVRQASIAWHLVHTFFAHFLVDPAFNSRKHRNAAGEGDQLNETNDV
jgi:hypothetical protein